MQKTMLDRLKNISDRRRELERLLSLPETSAIPGTIKKFGREYNDLQTVATLWEDFQQVNKDLEQTKQLMEESDDSDIKNLAKTEIIQLEERINFLVQEIKNALIPKDATEHADAVIEVRAGAGGDEAGLFAGDLVRMYQRYAELHNWKFKELDTSESGIGGIKEATIEISGDGAFRRLKLESGVHRVQRVPTTESQGRIHTSTATVAVMPKAEELDLEINDNDIRTDVFHSGGAGGQNVNKVATAIRLTHIPTGLVVTCQNERSQLQNRVQAMDILRSRLWDTQLRQQQQEIAASRKAQVGTGNRSEKIRTYNFPQSRVTDHRINYTSHQLNRILEGEIDEFVNALLAEEQARKLASIS